MHYFFFFFLLLSHGLFSQADSIQFKRYEKINWTEKNDVGKEIKLWKKTLVPIGLAGLSCSLLNQTTKTNLQTQIREPFNGFQTELDDYLQYAPVIELYSVDLLRFKARNSVWNQTKYLAISELLTSGLVQIMKYSIKIQRPENGAFNSFPSGHTSQAFVESQVLYNEFNQSNKFIAYSGFFFSISTGSLRVINNKHWVPDVLMGASLGILVTNLVYHFKPLKNWNPWKKKPANISFVPSFDEKFTGFYFKMKL